MTNVWCDVFSVLSVQSSSQRLRLEFRVVVQSEAWNLVFERMWLVLGLWQGTRNLFNIREQQFNITNIFDYKVSMFEIVF